MTKFFQPTSRRAFLRSASLLGLAALTQPLIAEPKWLTSKPRFLSYPFTLGVASGDPLPTGFVIWTRLAPNPLDATATGDEPVPVSYEVAEDIRFQRLVARGGALAHPENAHAVHVDVQGLRSGRPYYYRFHTGDEVSPIGRARTLPDVMAPLDRYKLAVCSCQNYDVGYFKAYRDMIANDVDMIVHLGDYIYEKAYVSPLRRSPVMDAVTLDDYQAAHAFTSWLLTWDDHEVANDYAADQGENFEDPNAFLIRRAAAYKAYFEHLPLRRAATPIGPDAHLFQRVNIGNLLEINMLDTRQYRSDQPCQTPTEGGWQLIPAECAEAHDPARTILGAEQERWLLGGMGRMDAKWTVLAQGMLFSKHDYKLGEGELIGSEYWDGYLGSRDRVLDVFEKRKVNNPVIIGGDVHAWYVCDVKRDFDDPASKTIASEFVATSITSGNSHWQRNSESIPDNPHIKLYEGRHRGYTLCDVTNGAWTADLRGVGDVLKPELKAETIKRFVVEDGKPGPVEA
jgi:alkaline phosphatase D